MDTPDPIAARFQSWKEQLLAAPDETARQRVIEQLIAEYLPYVQLLARARLSPQQRSRFDSEDIRQSIGWRVADRLRDGRLQLLTEGQFRGLLKTMVRNLVLDRGAKRAEHSLEGIRSPDDSLDASVEPADGLPTASADLSSEEVRRHLWQEIERHLQPDEFYLFREYYREGREYADLAAEMGLAPDAVRMRLNRARDKLRQRLGHLQEWLE